jgi:hypothetical protein
VGQLGTECCHLAGKVLDTMQKCVALREWLDAHEHGLGCDLDDAVCAVSRSISLGLAGKNGLYVGW